MVPKLDVENTFVNIPVSAPHHPHRKVWHRFSTGCKVSDWPEARLWLLLLPQGHRIFSQLRRRAGAPIVAWGKVSMWSDVVRRVLELRTKPVVELASPVPAAHSAIVAPLMGISKLEPPAKREQDETRKQPYS
jgi:hypothetical protein